MEALFRLCVLFSPEKRPRSAVKLWRLLRDQLSPIARQLGIEIFIPSLGINEDEDEANQEQIRDLNGEVKSKAPRALMGYLLYRLAQKLSQVHKLSQVGAQQSTCESIIVDQRIERVSVVGLSTNGGVVSKQNDPILHLDDDDQQYQQRHQHQQSIQVDSKSIGEVDENEL